MVSSLVDVLKEIKIKKVSQSIKIGSKIIEISLDETI